MSYVIPPTFMQAFRDAAEESLLEEVRPVLTRAQAIAPYERGDLAGSGEIIAFWVGDTFYAAIGFGGTPETAPYALKQHEDMSYKHPNGRQAKYAETPALAAQQGLDERLGTAMAAKVGRNVG